MRRLRILVACAVLLVPILACGSSGGGGGGGGGGGSAAAPSGPPVEVDPCAVQRAYQQNEVSAQQEYPEGQNVIVAGNVDRVAVTFGNTYVYFRACSLVGVQLQANQQQAAGQLSPGQPFRAQCRTGGYMMTVSFDDCVFVD
jgi:hypothetical protein